MLCMGPSNASDQDTLFDSLRRLRAYRQSHPDTIICYPSESPSHLWEVSLPGASTMAFDSIDAILDALEPIPPSTDDS